MNFFTINVTVFSGCKYTTVFFYLTKLFLTIFYLFFPPFILKGLQVYFYSNVIFLRPYRYSFLPKPTLEIAVEILFVRYE
jgi:hypothetical protein